nr:EOG090X0MNC [Scapholeberis mucronata]
MFNRKGKKKSKSKICSAEEETVKKANEQEDPFQQLVTFQSFNRNGLEVQLKCSKVKKLSKDDVVWSFDLLKRNMQSLYEMSAWGWNEKEKRAEMTEESAFYLIAYNKNGGNPVAFSHFRFDMDYGQAVLYCYELQLELECRQKGLGKFMLQILELMAFRAGLSKVILTVFSHNPNAIAFFKKLGYSLDDTSPENTLEEQFDYIILSKPFKRNVNS